ncbi:hypothetical protein D5S17_32780 [Pseudonocardiaceae bacterium YIM PH 21723]|nr:hypothetical protein D5S17_32780 [Pseudonocardiaceae bacterium YIM PH 21723]
MRLLYRGEPGRYYPTLALIPEPGAMYDLPECPPDGLWEPAPAAKPAKPSKPTTTAATPAGKE